MNFFSEIESTCDILMNEVRMEDEPLLEPQENINLEENESFQIEGNKNLGMNEEKMKENFLKLHVQRSFWRGNNINALCWAFYYANDNKEIHVIASQTMHCIFSHSNPILNLNPKTQARKGLIIYNITNGITTLRKHVNVDHSNVLKKFEKEVNCLLRQEEKQPSKRRSNISYISISSFVFARKPFKKEDVQQKYFLEDLNLLVVKNHLPL
jgi:hypothetical protein